MDDVRGTFGTNDEAGRTSDWDARENPASEDTGMNEQPARQTPPGQIGQDERRMQVRAYNHWASLLGERTFPSIEELDPADITDFGPNSVLLDFSSGIEDPVVQYLGDKLADECGALGEITRLSDVPPRSLLSRITDHYMQILANQAPIGFEAEFVNADGVAILYRGILLPYSSDDETIDFIYGVINWKEMADQQTADELLLEIDQALDGEPIDEDEAHKHPVDPVTDWADAPTNDEAGEFGEFGAAEPVEPTDAGLDALDDNVFELGLEQIDHGASEPQEYSADNDQLSESVASLLDMPGPDKAYLHAQDSDPSLPDFDQYALDDPEDEDFESGEDEAAYHFASLADYIEAPAKKALDLDAEPLASEHDEEEPEVADTIADHDQAMLPQAIEAEPKAQAAEDAAPEPKQPALVAALPADGSPDAPDGAEADAQFAYDFADPAAEEPVAESELPDDAGIYDYLAAARELAQSARASEDRSRHALYAAVGRAYDFSLAAQDAPEDYAELIEESGLAVQDRAPMTPVVKLVFGSDYDKTRLTEYAAVLSHAHRLELERGGLTKFLSDADGGLKGVVQAERRLRRQENGKSVEPLDAPRASLARKLRKLDGQPLDTLSAEGAEFALVMIRRDGDGGIELIGEIGDDVPLIERAAKKLVK